MLQPVVETRKELPALAVQPEMLLQCRQVRLSHPRRRVALE